MKPGILALAGLLLLNGCEPAPGHDAAVTQQAASAGQPMSPSTASTPLYAGRWAATEELCADGAWVIDEKGLHTAGEVSCRFDGLPEGAGPVEVDATCYAEGPPRKWRLRLAWAEAGQALLIQNGPFADMGLIRCATPVSSAEDMPQ